MRDVVSGLSDIRWPAVATGRAAQLLALQYQFDTSQWFAPAEIEALQQRQLASLVAHAYRNVPFYRSRFDEAGLAPAEVVESPDNWRKIPLLSRTDIQTVGDKLHARTGHEGHGRISQTTTSGSSGQPVTVRGTAVTRLFWDALTLRQHLWHNRDFRGKLAAARYFQPPHANKSELRAANWGSGTAGILATGPSVAINIREQVNRQAAWLLEHSPDYLLSHPSNVHALVRHLAESGQRPANLRQVLSFGETLEPHVRRSCHELWGVDVIDMYSSQEVGYIALQCPGRSHYHVQSESLLVEVLDDFGRPCQPGEVGRVVLTTLQNFAMPLLRYDIGDWAEPGQVCDCGRGLQVLNRIVGRQRNIFRLPTGERFFPAFEFDSHEAVSRLPPVRQFQIIQRTLEEVEVVLVVFRPLTETEEQQITALIQTSLRYPFRIKLTYTDKILAGPTGKYEDFCSDLGS